MKKILFLLLMPLAVLSTSGQSNGYNMVIELKNGTTITLGADEVENLTFNGEDLSVSGSTIDEIIEAIANNRSGITSNKSEIDELWTMINQLKEKVYPERTFTVNGVSFKMIPVAGGTFQMGGTSEQGSSAASNEKPVHSVTLSDYMIGKTEVTQELWYAVMGQKPTSDGYQWKSTYGLGDNYPVYYVSWNDCQTFISELNRLTGMQFRLPTEAEWEFAARGGTRSMGYKYSGSNNLSDVAWYWSSIPTQYEDMPGYGTQPVATKAPNELGIYDMSGNVIEWCQDWYGDYSSSAQTNPTGPSSGSMKLNRGGGFYNDSGNCRVSYRSSNTIQNRHWQLGLRLAL